MIDYLYFKYYCPEGRDQKEVHFRTVKIQGQIKKEGVYERQMVN